MSAELLLFYIFGGGAVLSAALMLLPTTGRNPIHSALLLIASLFCLAGLYAVLSAHLLTALQVIVYAGAIMVLFTFVIMLLNLSPAEIQPPKLTFAKVLAGVLALFVFGKLLTALQLASQGAQSVDLQPVMSTFLDKDNQDKGAVAARAYEGFGSVKAVGRMIYSSYMVPFELASVLLLVAAVGAVAMAKKSLKYVTAPVPPPAKLTKLAADPHGDEDGSDAHGGDHH